MPGKYFLIDTTKCTACRGCQVACQQWNHLPATPTKQTGTHQNPPELNGVTYRLVRFAEHPSPVNSMVWYFFSDACRHCLQPPCKEEADEIAQGAIVINDYGGVVYTEKTKQLVKDFMTIQEACPWRIPQLDKQRGVLTKCDMCFERVAAGLLPACAKACPTGALNFGDEADIKALAAERLAAAQKRFGDAAWIMDEDEVRVLYLVVANLDMYMQSSENISKTEKK